VNGEFSRYTSSISAIFFSHSRGCPCKPHGRRGERGIT
jgi:hypothetical protein